MDIIGHKLEIVNYITSFEGQDDYSNDPKADFDYLPFGFLHFKLSNGISYSLADYNSTKLTDGVGIIKITNNYSPLLEQPVSDRIKQKWVGYIGQRIKNIYFYIQTEGWIGYKYNEDYPESLQIEFENGKSMFYFCGDVEEYDESKGRYELIGNRSCGVIFFEKDIFVKYGLDKVKEIVNNFP